MCSNLILYSVNLQNNSKKDAESAFAQQTQAKSMVTSEFIKKMLGKFELVSIFKGF